MILNIAMIFLSLGVIIYYFNYDTKLMRFFPVIFALGVLFLNTVILFSTLPMPNHESLPTFFGLFIFTVLLNSATVIITKRWVLKEKFRDYFMTNKEAVMTILFGMIWVPIIILDYFGDENELSKRRN